MKYEYKFEPEEVELPQMEVQTTSMAELMSTLSLYQSAYNDEDTLCKKLHENVDKLIRGLTFEDFHNQTEAFFQYKDESEYEDDHKAKRDLYSTALQGIKGALRYYTALELNNAFKIVLPKYTGKQAGPKTREKFWKDVAGQLPVPLLRIYMCNYHTISVGRSDRWDAFADLYYNENLVTEDNRFKSEFSVVIPNDSFEGAYPVDWSLWARHIRYANNVLKTKFDEFIRRQDILTHSLKIGDVPMLQVYKYDQKERR